MHQLGKGGFANVHLIYLNKYNQHFALKQSNRHSKFELINELELLKKISHPKTINLYSMININSNDCIILKYCSDGNLHELIKSTGVIQNPKLYEYCYQILLDVDYLYPNKIANRDIKSSNILLAQNGRIKLADFVFSILITSNIQTDFCGTKMFISPEI
jgi:serine/threonine protein kinase